MHPGPAHLLKRGLLLDHHLHHPGAAQVHRGVAVHHDHVVAERGDIGAPRRRRAEQGAQLRDRARGAHLSVKDLPGAAAAGEHVHLVGDPGACRVHQVDHRNPRGVGLLDDPDDLLDGACPPGARLDRGVVRHQRHRPAADRGGSRDHAVGGQAIGQHVGVGAVLGKAALVGEQRDPVPGKQLAVGGGRLVIPGSPAGGYPGPDLGKLGAVLAFGRDSSGRRSLFAHGRERTESLRMRRLRLRVCGCAGYGCACACAAPPSAIRWRTWPASSS